MSDSTGPNLISPNEMLELAKDHMLRGEEPKNEEDWCLILNFVALNTHSSIVMAFMPLFLKLYNIPISESEALKIAEFQLQQKANQENGNQ